MRNNRVAASIMCIFFSICSFFILALPAWYFSDTKIMNIDGEEVIQQSKIFLNILEYKKLENLYSNYSGYGASLNLAFLNIFNILIAISLALSLTLIIILIIEVKKKSHENVKLSKASKIISIISLVLTISALTIALLFASKTKFTVTNTDTFNQTLSFNLSAGIYLFLIFNIASASCGIISPTLKEPN